MFRPRSVAFLFAFLLVAAGIGWAYLQPQIQTDPSHSSFSISDAPQPLDDSSSTYKTSVVETKPELVTRCYEEGKKGKSELRLINGIPVLFVEGTPEEIGSQIGAMVKKQAHTLLSFPKEYLEYYKAERFYPILVQSGKGMVERIPDDYLTEMKALAKSADADFEKVIVGNTFLDIKKAGGCASLFVDADRSATGGPLLARNLDWPTLGYLEQYSLVIVYRPKGKHAFVSIGFPGFVGCLSGMNEMGLAVACLESYSASDGSRRFEPEGTPYAMCYRRILEECATVAEAEKLLRSMKRTTMNILAVADPKGGAVFEVTPKNVLVREPIKGVCPCTNHFRSKELTTKSACWRYPVLEKCAEKPKLDLPDLREALDKVSQGKLTLQAMIFEPKTLKLHLQMGKCPATEEKPHTLEVGKLMKREGTKE